MKVAIISIGDELLIGQVVNKNAAWISEHVARIGAKVVAHSTIGDDAEALISELRRLAKNVSMILMTGGLGPTHDDITKVILAQINGEPLVIHEAWLAHLTELMKSRGRELTKRNADQALIPESATVIHNAVGSAPGLEMDVFGTTVIAMPGVPIEMRSVMNDHVLPKIADIVQNESEQVVTYHTIHATGIAESNLADILGDPQEFLGNSSLAFLPNVQGIRLRIGAGGNDEAGRNAEIQRIVNYLTEKASKYLYGEGDTTLSEVIGEKLILRGENVAVAESCTGGLLGAAFTDIPGSSAWFEGGVLTYSNEAKTRELHIAPDVIEEHGAVSEVVASAMSEAVREKFRTDWGIGVTGIAGPGGGSKEKPVGLVYVGLSGPDGTVVQRLLLGNDRDLNRQRSVGAALSMFWRGLR